MMGNVVEIRNSETIVRAPPTRRFIYLVLLLAVKDQVSEVKLEPSESEGLWKLRYKENGIWHEWEPIPLHVSISRAFRRLVGMKVVPKLLLQLRRLLWGRRDYPLAEERPIRLIIAGQSVAVTVSVHAPRNGSPVLESVRINLPCDYVGSEEAYRILHDFLQSRHPSEEQSS
jgi:hypothetical protein